VFDRPFVDTFSQAMMKPGGHGAIWKLMHDEGVFDWLRASGGRGVESSI
jgi:UDP-N-acetylglucosamine pyrophosphorylase